MKKPYRFNELQRALDGISHKVLTDTLKSMERDGLVERIDFHENPPHVEYQIATLGKSLLPIIKAMEEFGIFYKNQFD